MKKFLPYIFTLVIIANILAPISVIFSNNKAEVVTQKAEAANDYKSEITETGLGTILVEHKDADGVIAVTTTITWKNQSTNDDGIDISLKDEAENTLEKKSTSVSHTGTNITTGSTLFVSVNGKTITRGKKYTIFVSAWTKDSNGDYIKNNGKDYIEANPIVVNILSVQDQKSEDIKTGNRSYNFKCALFSWFGADGTWSGCFTGIFDVIFGIAAWLFGYAGMFFDWTVGYSLDSNSYRSAFVTEGWGIVRDMCNVFFIFILLYVAFATVLNLHGFKTKEMIVNVVIIGLLINFSLFTTQVIIDSSNILARVFYNNVEVNVGTNTSVAGVETGVDKKLTSNLGEKHLSALLISKVNPQEILLNAERFNVSEGDGNTGEISASTYLIITLLSIAMCIIGTIVFLSVGLIFIARVIGLWLAMILVPLTFFSYTVPALQSVDMVGWKKWWPETLKLSFLAPVFMFFLYLIIKFLTAGLGLFNADSKDGIQWVMGVIIPFAFLMILLWKAKGIAKTMSGELGQQITGAVTATAGLALGGAALGTAFLGRQTIGSFMKGAATGETAADRLREGRSRGNWDRIKGVAGYIPNLGQRAIRNRLNADQARVEGYSHARSALDAAANQRFHGKKWEELTQPERNTVRENISRDHEGESMYGKKWSQLDAAQKAAVDAVVRPQLAARTSHADHYVQESIGKQGLISNIAQASRNGSYDVRNLSKIVANEYDRGFSKFMTGITSTLASGIRGGFKNVGSGLNYGEGQKDFIKDLGHTITEALKSASVKVDLSHVGEEHKEDHGGGGHH